MGHLSMKWFKVLPQNQHFKGTGMNTPSQMWINQGILKVFMFNDFDNIETLYEKLWDLLLGKLHQLTPEGTSTAQYFAC